MDTAKTLPEIEKAGKYIYENELKGVLEPGEIGKYIVIEVESKKYFISEFLDQALQAARKAFPDKVFYSGRIGYPGVFSFSSIRSNGNYQWLSG